MSLKSVSWVILRICFIFTLLYFFICSLDLLSTSFKLLAGKNLGDLLGNDDGFLSNPIVGLMIGILGTVLVQSSSTFTSIIISMTGTIIDPEQAVPMIMGANIGTSVTNTIVSLTQVGNKEEFRRAFSAATVHDMFNWCTVLIMLPIEIATGFLYNICSKMAESAVGTNASGEIKLLKYLTEPFTDLIIQIESDRIAEWTEGDNLNCTMVLHYCPEVEAECWEEMKPHCHHMFAHSHLDDWAIGLILLILSLFVLCGSLILMVKILNSLLQGAIAIAVKKVLNPNFNNKYVNYFWGYFNIMVGAVMTFIVQSSSVFTSTLTPLVGIGLLTVETVYPLFLGSNIGTTTTGLLSALAKTNPEELTASLTVALVHLFFNLSGILIYYPIPFMRIPIGLCKILGNTTAKYRWFALFYLFFMFVLMPTYILVTSLNLIVFLCLNIPILLVAIFVIIINVMQRKEKLKKFLPKVLHNWNFLPKPLHSIGYYDKYISGWKCCQKYHSSNFQDEEDDLKSLDGEKVRKSIATIEKGSLENKAYEED